MQQGGFGRSLLTGALIGLVLVAVVVGYLLWNGLEESKQAGPDDVVVMLVLPDEEGVVLPRVVTRYVTTGEGTTAKDVDVRAQIEIPGTSYTQLRDAYTFQGPAGVASAVGTSSERTPSYVVIDAEDYAQLMGEEPVEIEVPAHMEVFDGARLHTFEQGVASIGTDAIAPLFNGLQYLEASQRDYVRVQVGKALGEALAADPSAATWLETDLSAEEYAQFATAAARVVGE